MAFYISYLFTVAHREEGWGLLGMGMGKGFRFDLASCTCSWMGYTAGLGIVHISTCLVQGFMGWLCEYGHLAGNARVIHTVRYILFLLLLPALNCTHLIFVREE
jgi:hypothetical protein